MNFVRFKPLFQKRIWGGHGLNTFFGRTLPADAKIGESWDIVDRPEAQSVIEDGEFTGLTLGAAIETHGERLLGPDNQGGQRFPLIVKWLDCQKRLSLQVHPPGSESDVDNAEPKTENWYVASATPDAYFYVGFKNGVTREGFEQALHEDALESLLHRVSVSPGDSMFVPSGRIHAIVGGVIILEIQQNSDTTYRIHDWGRIGDDGKSRALHIEESLRSINFDDFEPHPIHTDTHEQIIADCPEFRIRKITLLPGQSDLNVVSEEQPRLLHLISGHLNEKMSAARLQPGDNILLPFMGAFTFEAVNEAVILITDNFIA